MKNNFLNSDDIMRLPDGKHADGKYLYLYVRGESRSWVVRGPCDAAGKRSEYGLGSVRSVSLSQARRKRDDLLAQLLKLKWAERLNLESEWLNAYRTEGITIRAYKQRQRRSHQI